LKKASPQGLKPSDIAGPNVLAEARTLQADTPQRISPAADVLLSNREQFESIGELLQFQDDNLLLGKALLR
jgi:hypothetical protein